MFYGGAPGPAPPVPRAKITLFLTRFYGGGKNFFFPPPPKIGVPNPVFIFNGGQKRKNFLSLLFFILFSPPPQFFTLTPHPGRWFFFYTCF